MPDKIMVMRHRPDEPALRIALPWLAEDRHDLFNGYQSSHNETVERSLCKASHLASFIGHEPGRALFVGIYGVAGWREVSTDEFWAMKRNQELGEMGSKGPAPGRRLRWFDLVCSEHLVGWKGKLEIEWTGGERSYWRWAERNVFPVHAIHKESMLVQPIPPWRELVLDWVALQALPESWRAAISQWRGIYVILDRGSRGQAYVGSAYGTENILGRWLSYADRGDGGNVGLKGRDPLQFQFAVLERVSPDMPAEDVIRIEETWKKRLATREFGLNGN